MLQNLTFKVYQKTCDSLMELAYKKELTVLAHTLYGLLVVFWYAHPEAAPLFNYGAPLIMCHRLCTNTSRQYRRKTNGVSGAL